MQFDSAVVWMMCSSFVHIGAGGGAYYYFVKRQPAPIVAELDLSMSPLSAQVANPGGGMGKHSEAWVLPKKGKPPVPAAPEKVEAKEEVVKEDSQAAPCEGVNCSDNGTGDGGGGTGEGFGQYIPAEKASRKPRWIRNFITSRDYPLLARQQGKDGRVVLMVLIDNEGRVRDAQLLQGSYDVLNETALRKIKEAVFTPAYDDNNRPVACKAMLPIRFELR